MKLEGFLNFAHLLTITAVTSITLEGPLAFLLLTNAPYTQANDQSVAASAAAGERRFYGEQNVRYFTRPYNTRKTSFVDMFFTTQSRIVQNPPDSLEVGVGSRVELQCGVYGNPPPQVYWISGNEPERQIQELTIRAQEMGNIVPVEWEGPSQVFSTYVIDCVKAEDQGLKYCVSVSNNKVAYSTPTVLLVDTSRTTECSSESQPTITLHSSWRFGLQGSTIILPCRITGQPTPYLFWLDNLSKTITPNTHTRHTVLPNGDLQITDLDWADMGEYTCKVQSGNTEKSIITFVYPTRPKFDEAFQ